MRTITRWTRAARPAPRPARGQPVRAVRGAGAFEPVVLSVVVLVCALADAATASIAITAGGSGTQSIASDPGWIGFLVLKLGTAILACIILSTYRHLALFRWSFRFLAGTYLGLMVIQAAGLLR